MSDEGVLLVNDDEEAPVAIDVMEGSDRSEDEPELLLQEPHPPAAATTMEEDPPPPPPPETQEGCGGGEEEEEVAEDEEEGTLTDVNMEAASPSPAAAPLLFFADATLDLAEAQGIADTPLSSTAVISTLPPAAAVPHMPFANPTPPPRTESFIREGAPPGVEAYGEEAENLEGIAMTSTNKTTTTTTTATTSSTSAEGEATAEDGTTEVLDRPLRSIRMDDFSSPLAGAAASASVNGGAGHGNGGGSPAALLAPANRPTYRPRPPRRPRDAAWAIAAVLVIPICFILPLRAKTPHDISNDTVTNSWILVAVSSQGRTVTFLATLFAYLATFVLGRVFYRTMGGGDGDDGRHLATTLIVRSNILSFLILPLLAVLIYYRTPQSRWFCVLPLAFFVREVFLLRDRALAPRGATDEGTTTMSSSSAAAAAPPARGDATGLLAGDDGRTTFFQALACAALDILSRSLRRLSFYRAVSALLLLQWALLLLWRWALFSALAVSHKGMGGKLLVLMALLGGKWATGIVTRILSLVASGGVTGWFAQQSILMDNMERLKAKHRLEDEQQQQQQQQQPSIDNKEATSEDEYQRAESIDTASDDYPMGYSNLYSNGTQDPAYRSADASAYSPVMDFDEGIDDDFDEEDVENGDIVNAQGGRGRGFVRGGMGGGGGASPEWTGGGSGGGSTVKAFLWSAVSVSFGSVAQCGLVGGLALWLDIVLRNIEALVARCTSRRRVANRGYRGMTIGTEQGGGGVVERVHVTLHNFIKSHSDLAMSHVAAYFKSFSRAANDVAALVDAAGVEPMIRDDITPQMCASVCLALAGTLTFFLGYILSHHKGDEEGVTLSDAAVCQTMLLAFALAYNLLFALLEPLRASIKAVYVCFAQHPQSLSQAFPLIYHRLHRIAQANLGT